MPYDPNDPLQMQQALYPVPPDLAWPPDDFAGLFTFAPAPPVAPVVPAPVEAPVPVAAAPTPVPAPTAPAGTPAPLQPGLGIPPETLDAVAPPGPAVADIVSVQPELTGARDPWQVQTGEQPRDPDADRLAETMRQSLGPLTPDPTLTPEESLFGQLDTLDDRQLAEYGKRDPEGFAAYLTKKDEDRRIDIAQRGADIAQRGREAQAENIRIRTEALKKADAAQAQLQQESDNMAADGGFWDSRTDGQKFLGLLSIGLGAFVAGPHGENKALAIWQRAQDQHIANAKRKLTDKGSAISQMRARIGDDFLFNESLVQSSLKAEFAELQTYEQLLDPRGTTVRKSAQRRREIEQAVAASEQKAREHAQKQYIEGQKFLLDIRKQKEVERHNLDTTKTANWNAAISAGRLKLDEKQHKDNLQLERDKLTAARDRELGELDREQGVGGVLSIDEKTGKPVYGQLKQADGKTTWHVPKGQHDKVLNARSGMLAYVDALSQLKALRAKAGGTNKFTSPSDQAEYDRLVGNAVFAFAKSQSGVSVADEQSVKLAKETIFGGDPSGYNVGDVVDRLDKSIDGAKGNYANIIRGAGFDGDTKQAIQHVEAAEPVVTATQEKIERLLEPQGHYKVESGLRSDYTEAINERKAIIDDLVRDARSSDPVVSRNATETLARVANESKNPQMREYVEKVFQNVVVPAETGKVGTGAPPVRTGVEGRGSREPEPGSLEWYEERDRRIRAAGQQPPPMPPLPGLGGFNPFGGQ